MLELIRKHKTLFSLIFVFSAVGMVVSMFANPRGTGIGESFSGTVAKVDGEEIHTRQLIESYSRRLEQAQQMMSEQLKGAQDASQRQFLEQLIRAQVSPDRVLEEMIQQKFLIATSARLGIRSSREGIRSLIESNEAFHKDGQFDPLLYRQRVGQPGNYERELAYQNQFMTLAKTFRQALAFETPAEQKLQAELTQKHVYETLSVNPRLFPEPKTLSAEEVKKFQASGEWKKESQDYYNRHISEFRSPEKVKASHILIRENEGGLTKIKSVREEIVSGKMSFETAAAKYSSDKANAARGGDLGYFEKQAMDPSFASAAFALSKDKSLSEPVKSSFGYHLIKFFDRQGASAKELKDVESEIAARVALESAKMSKAQIFMSRFKEASQRPSDSEVKRLGLQWTRQPEWSPLDPTLGSVGSVDYHLEKILALSKSSPYLSTPINSGENLVIVRWLSDSTPKAEGAETARGVAKSEVAFEYFLRKRFEKLEKDGKIKRSAKILNQLKEQSQGVN